MTEPSDAPYDLITMGRIGVDLYPLQTGVPLPRVETFGKFLGGSATNVAVAAARLGRSAAVISRTGADPFGTYIHQALAEFGVDDRWVTAVERYPTPVTFCEIFPPDDFPLYFYRFPKAPDLEIRAGELDLAAIGTAGVLWATVTGLCAEPSRTASAYVSPRSASTASTTTSTVPSTTYACPCEDPKNRERRFVRSSCDARGRRTCRRTTSSTMPTSDSHAIASISHSSGGQCPSAGTVQRGETTWP